MADEDAYVLRMFNNFLQSLAGGQFHSDLTDELEKVCTTLHNVADENGGVAKGKLSINIDFKLKGGVFEISQDFKTTLPHAKLDSTMLWATQDNRFTPMNPKQLQMFGPDGRQLRDVGGDQALRTNI